MQKFFTTISFLFVFSSVVFSRIESVKLIYDEKEIYRGNTFEVSLRTETHKGKVFLSKGHSKYDCQEFEYIISDGLEIVFLGAELFRIKVLDNYGLDKFTLKLKYLYNAKKLYKFDFRIYDYISEIEFLSINNTSLFFSDKVYKLEIKANLYDGTILNINDNGKVKCDDIDLVVLGGAEKINNNTVRIRSFDLCKPYFIVKLNIINDTSKVSNDTIKIMQNDRIVYTDNIGEGDVTIDVNVIYNKCINDSLLSVLVLKQGISKTYHYEVTLDQRVLILDFDRKNGIDGLNGRDGTRKIIDAEDGCDGEDGLDGRNIIVYYTRQAEKYKSKLIISTKGGKGGRAGRKGKGSRVNVCSDGITRTIYGRNGLEGRDGRPGNDGVVHYVLIKE